MTPSRQTPATALSTYQATDSTVVDTVQCTIRATGNERMPIQLAQRRFPGLATYNANILTCFSNKIHGGNFVEQHSETVTVGNYQNADCAVLRNKILCYLL